jgi:DNA (cytosine-5)-methyltransferase 1
MGSQTKAYRLGELFCGAGGMAYGALKAISADRGSVIEHGWATDIDPDACETYLDNICRPICTMTTQDFPEGWNMEDQERRKAEIARVNAARRASVICRDVRDLDMSSLPPADALAFGFPCNDFSLAGDRRGLGGESGGLYRYCVKALEIFRPVWFMAENVGGIRSADDGKALKTIIGELAGAGYAVTSHLYRFEDYGIPQARHRVIIAGIREDRKEVFRAPSPEPYADADNTCRTALECPPIPFRCRNHDRPKHSPDVIRRLEHILPGQNAFTADLPEELRIRTKSTISQIYRRLDPDRPAYTVTGSGGGGTSVYHYSEPRALSNRERARLQTFPDDFWFCGKKESVRRQIGMAVPPRMAGILFTAMLDTLAGNEYPSVAPSLGSAGRRAVKTA